MKPKTLKALYWIATVFFALLMLLDGFGGVTRQQEGKDVMIHLGYPEYVLTIFGVAKLLGAIAIIQTKYKTLKEWAYAGFAFTFIGALASRYFAGDGAGEIIFPLIALGIMFIPYFLWKKIEMTYRPL
ncbi:MAG: DoxX family protein [Chitinophagaceae bacterium]|nr:DoxX family protein [Chitinophagaceae bacterium]